MLCLALSVTAFPPISYDEAVHILHVHKHWVSHLIETMLCRVPAFIVFPKGLKEPACALLTPKLPYQSLVFRLLLSFNSPLTLHFHLEQLPLVPVLHVASDDLLHNARVCVMH